MQEEENQEPKEEFFTGVYEYFQNKNSYSQETFKVEKAGFDNLIYSAEILSRVATGEFLKVYVVYRVTGNYEPVEVSITRYLGEKHVKETYTFDDVDRGLNYKFHNHLNQIGTDRRIINGRFQITTPAFCTSLLMTQARNMNKMGRTPYALIYSNNTWLYEGTFLEKTIFMEPRTQKDSDFTLNGKILSCDQCNMYEFDKSEGDESTDIPIIYYISKHLGLPYRAALGGNIEIKINKLINTESQYKNMF